MNHRREAGRGELQAFSFLNMSNMRPKTRERVYLCISSAQELFPCQSLLPSESQTWAGGGVSLCQGHSGSVVDLAASRRKSCRIKS